MESSLLSLHVVLGSFISTDCGFPTNVSTNYLRRHLSVVHAHVFVSVYDLNFKITLVVWKRCYTRRRRSTSFKRHRGWKTVCKVRPNTVKAQFEIFKLVIGQNRQFSTPNWTIHQLLKALNNVCNTYRISRALRDKERILAARIEGRY